MHNGLHARGLLGAEKGLGDSILVFFSAVVVGRGGVVHGISHRELAVSGFSAPSSPPASIYLTVNSHTTRTLSVYRTMYPPGTIIRVSCLVLKLPPSNSIT